MSAPTGSALGRLLLVDDDQRLCERLARALERRGFEVCAVGDYGSALGAARAAPFDFAVLDLRVPGGTGLELLSELRRLHEPLRAVLEGVLDEHGAAMAQAIVIEVDPGEELVGLAGLRGDEAILARQRVQGLPHEIVVEGLSMPHSPRYYDGKLWLLDSGSGYFGYVDMDKGAFERVAFCPGYLRGLSFHGHFAIVGLSKQRGNRTFSGLALDDGLKERDADPRCGLQVIDLRTGDDL